MNTNNYYLKLGKLLSEDTKLNALYELKTKMNGLLLDHSLSFKKECEINNKIAILDKKILRRIEEIKNKIDES